MADDSNGNILWALTDNLGTVRDVVNSSGVVQNHIKYDSFGKITSQTSPGNNIRFSFTGREWDALIGLYFYRGRYYDPVVGRFINEDPISFAGGDVNLYRYVNNNPVIYTDPFGYFVPPARPPLPWILIPLIPLVDLLFPEPFGDPEWSDPPRPRPKPKPSPTATPPSPRPTPTDKPKPSPQPTPAPSCPNPGCDDDTKKSCRKKYPQYDNCSDLEAKGFKDKNLEASRTAIQSIRGRRFMDYRDLVAEEGQPFDRFVEFGCKSPIGAKHYNVFIKGTRDSAGSIGRCKCCGNQPEPEFRYKILNIKDKAGNKYPM
jgi:RHS repeat-associated protein